MLTLNSSFKIDRKKLDDDNQVGGFLEHQIDIVLNTLFIHTSGPIKPVTEFDIRTMEDLIINDKSSEAFFDEITETMRSADVYDLYMALKSTDEPIKHELVVTPINSKNEIVLTISIEFDKSTAYLASPLHETIHTLFKDLYQDAIVEIK